MKGASKIPKSRAQPADKNNVGMMNSRIEDLFNELDTVSASVLPAEDVPISEISPAEEPTLSIEIQSTQTIQKSDILVEQATTLEPLASESISKPGLPFLTVTSEAWIIEASHRLNIAHTYTQILDILRQYTLLGAPETVHASMNLFDLPVSEIERPSWNPPVAVWSRQGTNPSITINQQINTWVIIERLFQPDRLVVLSDVSQDKRLEDRECQYLLNLLEARALILVPLTRSGKWIGYLSISFSTSISFTSDDLNVLSTMATLAVLAIQSIQLREELQRQIKQSIIVTDLLQDIYHGLNWNELLNRIVHQLQFHLNYHLVTLYQADEVGMNMIPVSSAGAMAEKLKGSQLNLIIGGATVVGQAAATGQPCIWNEPAGSTSEILLPLSRAEIGIPLSIITLNLYVLNIHTTTEMGFSKEEISLLKILVNHIAVALENARTYAQAQAEFHQIQRSEQERTQLLSNLSHELRPPLNSIISRTRVLLQGIDGILSEPQRRDISAIEAASKHLAGILSDIIDLWQVEAPHPDLSLEDNLNLNELIRSVLATLQGLLKDKPVKIIPKIDTHLPLLRADPAKIRLSLIRIISFCAQSVQEGSITVEATQPHGQRAVVQVKVIDTGPVYTRHEQEEMLRVLPLESTSQPMRERFSGLSLARRWIELHHGQFGWDSTPSKGNTFWFILPVQSNLSTQPATTDEFPYPISMPRVILAIDNTPKVIQRYEQFLSHRGYKVIALTDLRGAVERVRELQPQAVTLDIAMQTIQANGRSLTGWQVLQRLKADPVTEHIPVFICSLEKDHEKAKKLGATGYLVKPISETDLVEALEVYFAQFE